MDDQFNEMFLNEMLISKLSRVFATLAIHYFLSWVYLALLHIRQNEEQKKLASEKYWVQVLQALQALLSKDFLKLVVMSCIVAFPIAWWMMHNWLQNYQYRIEISWWIFLIAGLVAIVIALVTVSFQAIKAAIANPVKSLRTE